MLFKKALLPHGAGAFFACIPIKSAAGKARGSQRNITIITDLASIDLGHSGALLSRHALSLPTLSLIRPYPVQAKLQLLVKYANLS